MGLFKQHFHWSVLLRWDVLGWTIGALLAIGGIVLIFDQYWGANVCFMLVALLIFAKIAHVAISAPDPVWQRLLFTFLLFGVFGVAIVETVRGVNKWADSKRTKTETASPSTDAAKTPETPKKEQPKLEQPKKDERPKTPGSRLPYKVPPAQQPTMPPSQVALFVDCDFIGFPVHIPQGTTAHILRIHPDIAKQAAKVDVVPVFDVVAPLGKERVWPSDEEAAPLPEHVLTGPPVLTSNAMKCTVRKYGNATVDNVVIPLRFEADDYNLLIDPLESSGTFDRFSFYLLNACYTKLNAGVVDTGASPIIGQFPKTATLHILGELGRKDVPLTVAYRANAPYNFIFLQPTYRHWQDLPPCY